MKQITLSSKFMLRFFLMLFFSVPLLVDAQTTHTYTESLDTETVPNGLTSIYSATLGAQDGSKSVVFTANGGTETSSAAVTLQNNRARQVRCSSASPIQNVAIISTSTFGNPLAISLTNNGYTVTHNDTSLPSAAILANTDAVFLIRANGNADLATWVQNGGVLITEWTGSVWALNTSNLIDATDSGGGMIGTGTPVTFTSTAIGQTLGTSLPNPYADGGSTEFFRNFTALGPTVEIHATRPGDIPAIIGDNAGLGYVLAIGYDYQDIGGDLSGSNTEQLVLNALTANYSVAAVDNEPPVITCVGNQAVNTDAGVCTYTHSGTSWDATATDNCSVASITYVLTGATTGTGTSLDGLIFNLGETTVSWTATDGSGNTDVCSFTLTVEDNEAPIAMCVAPFNLALDANGQASITPEMIDDGSTDNCGNLSVSFGFVQNGFNGDFAPANWNFNANGGNGSYSFDGANESLTLTGSDESGPGGNINTELCVNVVFDGIIQFNWNYNTSDVDGPSFDPFGYTINGNFVQLSNNAGGSSQSGVATINVSAGDVFCFVANTSDDCCGSATTVSNMFIFEGTSPSSFTCADLGDHTILISVTDDNGNTSLCTTTVTVVDDTDPDISCLTDQTVDTDTAVCTYTHNGTDWDATATDNCSVATITYELTGATTGTGTTLDGVTFNSGDTTVTWTATDASDNTAVCSFTVTVDDNEAPMALCVAPFTIQLDANGQASITVADIDAGSTDNCGIATIEIDRTDFDCSDLSSGGSTNYVYALYPWSGTNNIYLYDFDPVTLDLNFNSVAGSTNIEENYGFDVNPVTGEYYLLGRAGSQRGIYSLDMNTFNATLITTVTSTTGNQNAQDFVINNAGEFVILYQDGSVNKLDINTLTTTFFATVSTPGGGVGFTYDYENDRYLIAHNTNPVELKALSATGTVTNLFSFHTPVIPTCTAQAIEYVGNGKCIVSSTFGCDILYSIDLNTETVELIASPNGSPEDSIKDFLYNFSGGNGNSHTVTLTVTDVNGNVSTCTTTVTVEDSIAPAITCIANQTVDTDAAVCNYTHNGTAWDATATDNCSIASTVYELTGATTGTGTTLDGVVFNLGETTVTWTTTDGSGNTATCSFTVTVEDNEAPMALCVAPFTIQLDANGQASITVADIDAGSTDNCGIDTISISQTDFDCSHVGGNTITLTVTDVNGNTSTCTTVVTVEDNVAPEALCVAPFTIQLDANGQASITAAMIDNGSNDACGIDSISISQTDFDCSHVGNNTITLTVTDVNGNTSTCTTVVTVEDNVAPEALCVAPFTVELDFFGMAYISVSDIDNGSNDACGIASMSIDITEFSCANIGDNVVTLTVVDNNGNTSTCTTVVTVVDAMAPQIVCPNNIVINTEPGMCSAFVFFGAASAYDNCDGFIPTVQTAGPPSGSNFPIGVTTITFTATDSSGNTSSCDFTITVVDNQAPVAVCQNITIQLGADGLATITAEDLDGGSTDNCGTPLTFTASQTTFDCSNVGQNSVILTVTDAAGNSSTCTAIVTVEDSIAPVALCAAPFTIELDANGIATIDIADIDAGSTDNCSIASIELSQSTFTCADLGENVITLTVTDPSGNVSTCTTTVTVIDVIAPVLTCIDFTLELGPDGTAFLTPEDIGGTSTDNCAITITAIDIEEFDCSDIGTPVLVTYFASDASGNIASCTAWVTVVDNLGPVIDCPDAMTVDTDPNSITYTVPDYFGEGIVTATDNCTIPVTVFSQTPAPGTLLLDGTYTITLTATDEYGNTSTCSFELTVDTILGDEDRLDFSSLTMYPNPATHMVTIGNPQSIAIDRVSIYDVQGRLVFVKNANGETGDQTINVSDLSSAVYMVVIESNGRQSVKRLVRK